ncbi:T9SS type A sorting domain-containing protein [Faecalibacter rhinopitheci]|uniref:T9SS type A sorting domain-containing protein n=1 Tax=Faecalibacter rhinopitheci TaxID=2779678 RepID=A0A8J7G7Q0_9FLAO|nr:T9SS type A sorting domain-containing protein [Faecalibacter rhinopitheci]MBF0596780.1 T9SS type A sorting domain-containing protein [Faecalibacter rhinopitheci]
MKRLIYFALLLAGCISFGQQNSVVLNAIDISKEEGSSISSFFISNNKLHFTANQSRDYRWLYNIEDDKLKFVDKDNANHSIYFGNSKVIQFDENRFILSGTKNYTHQVFITDGTQSNTIDLGAFYFNDQDYVKWGNKLYFLVRNNGYEYFLYETDGTVLGTKKVSVTDNAIFSNFSSLKVIANELHFIMTINSKDFHYKIDTNQNLVQITNFDNLTINDFVKVNNKWFYNISNTYNTGKILTCENGNCNENFAFVDNNSLPFTKFLVLDNDVLFIEAKSINWSNEQSKVYKYNKSNNLFETITIDGNEITNQYLNFRNLFKFKGEWYVVVQNNNNRGRIYKYGNSGFVLHASTDNTIVSDFYFTDDNFYFSVLDNYQSFRIFRSDGTTASSGIVDEIGGVNSGDLITFKGELYFRKSDEINGDELWKYNEDTNITELVKNINYRGSGNVEKIKKLNDRLFFKGVENNVYSISTTGESVKYTSPESNYNYVIHSFFQVNNDVILFTEGNYQFHFSKLNEKTKDFEIIYTAPRFSFINPYVFNNKLYFVSNTLSEGYNSQLHYLDPADNSLNYVKSIANVDPDILGYSFNGIFELDGQYYYVSEGDNKGKINKLNLSNNRVEPVFRFLVKSYDNKQAIIVGKLNDKLLVNYDNGYYLYDGTTMTYVTDGTVFGVMYTETPFLNIDNQPIHNNKFYYLKAVGSTEHYDLWTSDGVTHEKLNIQGDGNRVFLYKQCNDKMYFISFKDYNLYETDGTAAGTRSVGYMDHSYIRSSSPMKCFNDKLFFMENYYGNQLSVIDNGIKKIFDFEFDDLPNMWVNYDYTTNMEVMEDKLYLTISHYYAGKEVFVVDYNAFNLTTLSDQNFDINLNLSKKGEVKVYPNPTTGKIKIIVNKEEQIKEIKIVNVTGQTILKQNINSHNNFSELDLSQLKKGIYFLNITTNSSSYSRKLIKK